MEGMRMYSGTIDGHLIGIVGSLLNAQRDEDYPFMESIYPDKFELVTEEEYQATVFDMRYEFDFDAGKFCWRQ